MVLIHAFSVDRRMWAPQIALLEHRFRVVRYDLRGHGKSEGPSAPYAPHEDLRSVLDALDISRATLIGLSAGATIATDFAIAYPNRVARLVLASPGLSGHVPSTPLTWTQPVFQAAGAGDAEGAARLWADTPIMAVRNDLSVAPAVREVILGEQDLPHIKEIAGLLIKGIAGARLVTIPRAGHMVNLDARETFNRAVEAFVVSR